MARSASIVELAGKLEVVALSMLGPSPPWTGQVAGAEHNRGCHGRTSAQTGLL